MKNVAKQLEWFDGSNDEMDGPQANVFDFLSFFIVTDVTKMSDGSKKVTYYGELFFERKGYYTRMTWSTFSLQTIEEAKAACQAYYSEMVFGGLSEDNQGKLQS
jgi:hypothetical protein